MVAKRTSYHKKGEMPEHPKGKEKKKKKRRSMVSFRLSNSNKWENSNIRKSGAEKSNLDYVISFRLSREKRYYYLDKDKKRFGRHPLPLVATAIAGKEGVAAVVTEEDINTSTYICK